MPTHFTPEALKFLRGIACHNDRAWFDPRKPIYERELKAPMLALIEEINHAIVPFAPDHIRPPHKAMMRIYRDTRFSSGGGFYLSLSATELTIAAGVYMPGPDQLLAIRRYLLDHHSELRALLATRKLRAAFGELEGHSLTRAPRGFPAHSPAIDLILRRQWGVAATLPAERALLPSLLKDIVSRFLLAAPIVHLLNTPLIPAPTPPLF